MSLAATAISSPTLPCPSHSFLPTIPTTQSPPSPSPIHRHLHHHDHPIPTSDLPGFTRLAFAPERPCDQVFCREVTLPWIQVRGLVPPSGRSRAGMISIRRMSLGSGYRYLMESVAVGDGAAHRSSMVDYYAQSGTPAGRFLGAGVAGLGDGQGIPVRRVDRRVRQAPGPSADRDRGDPLAPADHPGNQTGQGPSQPGRNDHRMGYPVDPVCGRRTGVVGGVAGRSQRPTSASLG